MDLDGVVGELYVGRNCGDEGIHDPFWYATIQLPGYHVGASGKGNTPFLAASDAALGMRDLFGEEAHRDAMRLLPAAKMAAEAYFEREKRFLSGVAR